MEGWFPLSFQESMQDECSILRQSKRPSSQDPISVMLALRSRILKNVASSCLLLIPPQSGGSFGATSSMQPVKLFFVAYGVAMWR